MDSSPRTGMMAFVSFEPLGRAPAYMTTAKQAVPKAPRQTGSRVRRASGRNSGAAQYRATTAPDTMAAPA